MIPITRSCGPITPLADSHILITYCNLILHLINYYTFCLLGNCLSESDVAVWSTNIFSQSASQLGWNNLTKLSCCFAALQRNQLSLLVTLYFHCEELAANELLNIHFTFR